MPKEDIRKEKLAKRIAMDAGDHARRSQSICGHLRDFLSGNEKQCVAAYIPSRNEPDILPVLDELRIRGITVALPVVQEGTRILQFRAWKANDKLTANRFGILEPPPSAATVIPDTLIIPCIAFDRFGYRIGYGGGYFDATLKSLHEKSPVSVGVAFDFQKVSAVPPAPFDVPLAEIITESGRKIELSGKALRQ